MRIFVSTGEVSGDLQGGMLVQSLYRYGQSSGLPLEIVGLGGQKMKKAGANLIADTTAIGSVGLLESLPFIIPTWQIQRQAKKYLKLNPPDLVILIDYLGPNLTIATFLKEKFPHIPIIWYIAPQFWVWTPMEQNVTQLVNVTNKVLAIFPEEANFYQNKGVSSAYVGHPLVERIKNAPPRDEIRTKLGIEEDESCIALFPASRKQELKYLLPVMIEAAQEIQNKLPKARFVLPISLAQYRPHIEALINQSNLKVTFFEGDTLNLLPALDLAITKSGTVNLELALLKIPQVVLYKVNPFTIWVGRTFFNLSIPFISPANLVLMEEIVPELLQEQATASNIVHYSLEFLLNDDYLQKTKDNYTKMIDVLNQGSGSASDNATREIFNFYQTQVVNR